ncbi:MAG: M50 family metallopeptidase [Ruminococcus sp.]|nr:M50 family metallopeptidase [Ruminococcus sp.]
MRLRIRFSFLLLNAVMFLLRSSRLILCFYAVSVMHELGHAAAVYLSGGRITALELSGFGIMMESEQPGNTAAEAAVLLAGPFVNLAAAGISAISGHYGAFMQLSLTAGIYNLLPYPGLDGGSLAELFITGSPAERGLRLLLLIVRIAVAAAGGLIFLCTVV